MKKILNVIALALALNFLAAIGGVGYLFRSGHLDKTKVKAIQAILFPQPATQPAQQLSSATTQPATAEMSLDQLVQKAAGMTAQEQVEYIQRSFDARLAELDLRQREVTDQEHEVDLARQQLAAERAQVQADQKALTDAQQLAAQQASDQGFQDTLAMYTAMQPPKVKDIFMTLDQKVVARYLDAMDAGKAAKIIKEFKSPQEMDRIQKVLEQIRLAKTVG